MNKPTKIDYLIATRSSIIGLIFTISFMLFVAAILFAGGNTILPIFLLIILTFCILLATDCIKLDIQIVDLSYKEKVLMQEIKDLSNDS